MRLLPLAAIAFIAAGCASSRPFVPPSAPETRVQAQERRAEAPRPAYNLAGYPPAVRDGYVDGCETAKETSLARKDARRIAADPQYAMGWNDGFALCAKK